MKHILIADIADINLNLARLSYDLGKDTDGRKYLERAKEILCNNEGRFRFEPHYQLVVRKFNEVAEGHSEKLKVLDHIIKQVSTELEKDKTLVCKPICF